MRVGLRRGGHGSGAATTPPSFQEVSEGRIRVATWPGEVRAACTATAASAPTSSARGRGADPGRDAARPALGIGGQRRIEGPVVDRLVADDVDDAAARPARVVQAGQAVGQARAAMQQGAGRLVGHAPVAVGAAGDDVLLQAEDAAHARDAVQRGDEMHLAGAGVGEADIDAAAQQRLDQAFGSVHAIPSVRSAVSADRS